MKKNSEHRRYEVGEWLEDSVDSWWARLYVGGDVKIAEIECRKACFPKGLCVTLDSTKYIFAGGTEEGIVVGFIQYPPFPEDINILEQKAINLGIAIAEANYQWSFSIVTPDKVLYLSRRRK